MAADNVVISFEGDLLSMLSEFFRELTRTDLEIAATGGMALLLVGAFSLLPSKLARLISVQLGAILLATLSSSYFDANAHNSETTALAESEQCDAPLKSDVDFSFATLNFPRRLVRNTPNRRLFEDQAVESLQRQNTLLLRGPPAV